MKIYEVLPQRSSATGWILCEPHQVEMWAVISVEHRQRSGHTYTVRKVLSRHLRRPAAVYEAHSRRRSMKNFGYRLGKRMGVLK